MKKNRLAAAGVAIAVMFAIVIYTVVSNPPGGHIEASADENARSFKWVKQAVEEGTTIDAEYLWPDETNPSFTGVYRDGEALPDEKMVTVETGSVYHFRGISEESILYTEVYVGAMRSIDVTQGETGTWYRLLPSAIRNDFEESGWTWETGWEYTGRAYLDSENRHIMIKEGDYTAVLYGMGLFLDNACGYAANTAFEQEGNIFKETFGDDDNLFALALECYYTRGGELGSTCPGIYTLVGEALSQLNGIYIGADENVMSESERESGPSLMTGLLDYVNACRNEIGLDPVAWDSADDDNVITRVNEVSVLLSQTRPDGSDAFSAYTDAVMCEMRITDAGTVEEIYNSAASYFQMAELKSCNCAVYGNVVVLIFVW